MGLQRTVITLQDVAWGILGGGSLEEKLRPFEAQDVLDAPQGSLQHVPELAARTHSLTPRSGVERLPALRSLVSAEARVECLHRFANHELQAVELLAWAVLRFPDAPPGFRSFLAQTLRDEQRHLSMYVNRLQTHAVRFGDLPVTGNLVAQIPGIQTPLAFVCAVGLTFENANLDFSLLYRDAFAKAGALEDAQVLHKVHRDERGHVAHALRWLRRLREPEESDLEAYQRAVPFPLGLHRAKGRNFVASARRTAGFDSVFIEALRGARSPQQDRPGRLE
jgi:uncharacterized ferritin-like protein (DUF455 family)